MNLYHLRYFVTLAHLEHYSKAAEQLHISQPNLTYAIHSLEQELGVLLFEKSGRNVVLSNPGKEFLQEVEKALSLLDRSVEKMQMLGKGSGKIELGFPSTLGIQYIPRLVSAYLKTTEEEVFFQYHVKVTTRDLIVALKERVCDLVFCSYVEAEADLVFTPLFTQNLVYIVPCNHELAERKEIDLAETVKYPQIFFHKTSGIRGIVDNLFQKVGAWPKILMELEEDQVIAGFVAEGLGTAVVPEMPFLEHMPVAQINIIRPEWERRFYMAYLKQHYQTPAVQSFIEYVKKRKSEKIMLY